MFHEYPLLPVRDLVVFPGMTLPLFIGRPQSLAAVAHAEREGVPLVLVAQRAGATEQPAMDELYPVGTLAKVLNRATLENGSMKVQVQATTRARLLSLDAGPDYRAARVEILTEPEGDALAAARDKLAPALARLYPSMTPAPRPAMDPVVAIMQSVLEGDATSVADRLERLLAAL